MESYEDILKRMREVYGEESGHSPEDVSDTDLRLRVLAGELYRLRAEIDWISRQAFPHTAAGEWLDRHGIQRGVARRPAANAKGTITFTRYLPLSFDLVIPKGTVCASSGEQPVEYETVEDAVLIAGELSVDAAAQAVTAGPGGNLAAGYVNTLVSSVVGVNYVNNRTPFSGGQEAESDEDYRPRVLAAYADLSNGTNAAYYKSVALAQEGVSAAGVVPRENGDGTVGVYIWGQGEAPSGAVIASLQREFEKRRETGVTVSVQAATETPVNVPVRIKVRAGADFAQARLDVEQAIRRYFRGLTVGSPVYLLELERAALLAAPVIKLEFGMGVRDTAGSQSVIPTAGAITVEEIA